MHHRLLPVGALTAAYCLLASASVAHAAAATWVSGTGTDAGNCPITAPCRTFAYAQTQANNNGAINVLSSGNFGPLTITKPISIVAEGVEAVINTGAGGAGIIVEAGGAAIVSLRGLTIDLRGTANDGISFVSGAALHVQSSVIRRAVNGIIFAPASGTSELYVADSVIANTAVFGILIEPLGSAGAKAVLDRVRVENSSDTGIAFSGGGSTGPITATVRDSVAAGNTNTGISLYEPSAGTTQVMIDRSATVNNFSGVVASGVGAAVRIGDSTVSGNNQGLFSSDGGVIESYGNNKVDGNGTDGAPTSTIPTK